MKTFLNPQPYNPAGVVGLLRIVIGLLMVYHGQEVFQPALMQEYTKWEAFKGGAGVYMVYAGKTTELVAGLLLTLGLFTRVGALLLIGALSYIAFFVGNGRVWYEDQHPFMFVLFGVLFLFYGPGSWSLDEKFFRKTA
ncbi:MAG: DoxX family protein [Bacteroidota bacterium]